MARKKSRQLDPNESSESGDNNAGVSGPNSGCAHITKAVDLGQVKKKLKGGVRTSCDMCSKKSKVANVVPDATFSNGEEEIDENWCYWFCLKCAHIGCGRGQYKHALAHFNTPRSDQHDLVVDIDSWIVWCYSCEKKMALDSTKKLKESVEYIRRHIQSTSKPNVALIDTVSLVECEYPVKPPLEKSLMEKTEPAKANGSSIKAVSVTGKSQNLPKMVKVRGLMNLGNTCFYNSVLQCLSVTPYLTRILKKLTTSGEEFLLPGLSNSDGLEVPLVQGILGASGALSNALLSILVDMRSPDLHADTLRPQELLKKVQQNFPQFRGHEQHDAHELLRHLLEGVRSDDLKRFQEVILKQNGLFKIKNNDVSDIMKKKMKLYGQQLQDLILGVEGIFKGQLVSIVECQDCRHTSTCFESFLDLSLPVMEDKPLPPMRKKEQTENFGNDSVLSKYQVKKQRKAAKRIKSHKSRKDEKLNGFPTVEEENCKLSDGVEAEQSDADIEDNVEQDSAVSVNSKEIGESGYSSDKHNTGESDGSSPSITATTDKNVGEVQASPTMSASATASTSPSVLASPTASISLNVPESPVAPAPSKDLTLPVCGLEIVVPSSHSSLTEVPADNWSDFHTPEHDCVSGACDYNLNCDASDDMRCFTPIDEELRITIPENGEGSIHISPVHQLERPLSRHGFNPRDFQSTNVVNSGSSLSALNQDLESKLLSLCIKERVNEEADFASNGQSQEVNNSHNEVPNKLAGYCNNKESTESVDGISGNATNISDLDKIVDDLKMNTKENTDESFDLKGQVFLSCENQSSQIAVNENEHDLDSTTVKKTCGGFVRAKCVNPGCEDSTKVEDISDNRKDVSDWCKTLAPRTQSEEGDCSVVSCLNQFTSLELMTGSNKVGCEACTQRQNKGPGGKTVYTNSTKQLLISSPPPVLILHLKRFMMENFRFKKLQRFVSFPLDLDIAPFCSTKCKESTSSIEIQTAVKYTLYGIVEHTGSLNSGHYVAYVKIRPTLGENDPRWLFLPKTREFVYPKVEPLDQESLKDSHATDGKWYSISDSRVVEIAESKVLKSQAYLLFYERIM